MNKKYKLELITFFALTLFTCLANTHLFARNEPKVLLYPLPLDEMVIEPSSAPEKFLASTAGADDAAKTKIANADIARKLDIPFFFPNSIKDAFLKYDEAGNDSAISADLRARAKIYSAELYPYSNADDSSFATVIQRRNETLSIFTNAIENTQLSIDLRGWIKIRLAKLYFANTFDIEPIDARKHAQLLLEEVIAEMAMGADTKARARLLLADAYIRLRLGLAINESHEKAKVLLNDNLKDPTVKAEIKADTKLRLAEIYNTDADPYHAEKFKALKELTNDISMPESITAKGKVILARSFLENEFDFKPSESIALAFALYKDISTNVKLDAAERYAYKQEFAYCYSMNLFLQKTKEFNDGAQALYKELLDDASATIDQKAIVKWQLAVAYLEKRLNPPESKAAKTLAIDLITSALSDPKLSPELWFVIKLNYARLHHFGTVQNLFELSPNNCKSQALDILNEMQGDGRLSGKQKEIIQTEIELWNGKKQ